MKCSRVNIKDKHDISITRPGKWGNPFSHKENSTAKYKTKNRKESITSHREWILNGEGKFLLSQLNELKGKVLGCFCKENQSCHGDTLVELVNNLDKKGIDIFECG